LTSPARSPIGRPHPALWGVVGAPAA
jgi:hypothetical protein